MASSNNDKRSRQARAEQMRKQRERADARRRNLITVGVVVVVLILIAAAGWAIKSQVDKNNAPAATPSGATKANGYVYDQKAATGKAGDKDPVSVVIYEDFQCPACGAFEKSAGEVIDKAVNSGQITAEYRPVAFIDDMAGNDYSHRSANAAACVFEDAGAKAFYEFHKLLYANQLPEGQGLSDDQLEDFAKQAGADDVGSCISSMKYEGFVEESTKKFSKYGSTPTVLVDGEEISGQNGGSPSGSDLQAAIAAAAK